MSRFARKTLRRLPPTTREIARLANELASVQTRLSSRIEVLASTEMMANASLRIDCANTFARCLTATPTTRTIDAYGTYGTPTTSCSVLRGQGTRPMRSRLG